MKCQTLSGESSKVKIQMPSGKSEIVQTPSAQLKPELVAGVFPLPYLTNLPDAETLRREILKTERAIRARPKTVERA